MDNKLDKIKEIEQKRQRLLQMGGPEAIEKQHQAGKLTARERLNILLDKGSFMEDGLFIHAMQGDKELPGDAIVTGIGKIENRPVFIYAQDFTVLGGTTGYAHTYKMGRTLEMARESRLPMISIVDSAGARLGAVDTRPGVPVSRSNFFIPAINSGVIPQVTIMLGPSYAATAYSPTISDFYIMRKRIAHMSVASPPLLKSVTHVDVTQEQIGGAELHATVTGTVDFLTETDEEALEICRELISYLPLNNQENPPVINTGDDPNRRDQRLIEIVPANHSTPYDMHEVIRCIVDNGRFLETQKLFAKSMIIGFARLDGHTIGMVANNPAERGGGLTIDTCDKETRFIRFCDCFNIPLVFLVDTCGFSSESKDSYGNLEEISRDGLLRTAPRPAFAICEATVPMVMVYIGECFGASHLMMGNLRMGVDFAYSWPSAQVAQMAPEEAVETIYQEKIAASESPDKVRREKLAELKEKYYNFPYLAAGQALVNELIDPRDTRPLLVRTLENLARKKPSERPWRKHSLIPK